MINYIADTIKINEKGEAEIPINRVIYEDQKRTSNTEIVVTYIFEDQSSVKIRYTLEKDLIIERKKGSVDAKLKRQY